MSPAYFCKKCMLSIVVFSFIRTVIEFMFFDCGKKYNKKVGEAIENF